MLAKLKLLSNLAIEMTMFGCAGIVGILLIPFVIGASWLELFREMKNEWRNLDGPLPSDKGVKEALDADEHDSEKV